jgi:phosphohistidine phosphatase
MEIYLLRHGIAVERTVGGKDRERTLTPKGRRKIEGIAKCLYELGISFDSILSSPFVRARQTAEMMASGLKHKGEVQYTGNLLPGGDPKALLKELKDSPVKAESLLLVGHEPDLSKIASYLLSGNTDLRLELKKGGLCKLDVESLTGASATLVWLVPPKLWED